MSEPKSDNLDFYWKFSSCSDGDQELTVLVDPKDLSVDTLKNAAINQRTTLPKFTFSSHRGSHYGFRLQQKCARRNKKRYHIAIPGGQGGYLFVPVPAGHDTVIASGPKSISSCNPPEGIAFQVSSCRYLKDLKEPGCQKNKKEVYFGDANDIITKFGSLGESLPTVLNRISPKGKNYYSFRFENGREGECFIIHGYEKSGDGVPILKDIHKLSDWSNRTIKPVGSVEQELSGECVTENCDKFTSTSEFCFKPTPTPDIRRRSFWVYSKVYHWSCPSLYGLPVRNDTSDGWIYMGQTALQKIDYEQHEKDRKKVKNSEDKAFQRKWYQNEDYFSHDWNSGPPEPFSGLGHYFDSTNFIDKDTVDKYQEAVETHIGQSIDEASLVKMMAYERTFDGNYIGGAFVKTSSYYHSHADEAPEGHDGDSDLTGFYSLSALTMDDDSGWEEGYDPVAYAPCIHDGKKYIDIGGSRLSIGEGTSATFGASADTSIDLKIGCCYTASIEVTCTSEDACTFELLDEEGKLVDSATLTMIGDEDTLTSISPSFSVKVVKYAPGSSKTASSFSPDSDFSCWSYLGTTNDPKSDLSEVIQMDDICGEECNPVYGCSDELACNYDSSTTRDDGSCEYETCYGCIDPEANNVTSATFSCEECPGDQECCDESEICQYTETPTITATLTPTPTPTSTIKYIILSNCLCDSMQLLNKVDVSPYAVYWFEENDPPKDDNFNTIADGDTLGEFESIPALAGTPIKGCINVEISNYNSTNLLVSGPWANRVGGWKIQRGFSCPNSLYEPCELDCGWFEIDVLECNCDGFSTSSSRVTYKSHEIVPTKRTFVDNGKCYASVKQIKKTTCDYYDSPYPEVPTLEAESSNPCKSCLESNSICAPTPTPGNWTIYTAKLCLEEDYELNGIVYNGCDPQKWGDGRTCFPFHPERRGKYKSAFGEKVSSGFKCTPDGSVYIEVVEEKSGNYFDWEQEELEIHNVNQYNDTDDCGCSC